MRVLFVFFLLLSSSALAVEPGEMLADPVLEARAREVTRQLRCPVCEGQDIDDSGAQLAADLRRIVREKLAAGESEEEIFSWLAARYGDEVLMNPPLKGRTLLLWAGPWVVFLGGLVFLLRRGRAAR